MRLFPRENYLKKIRGFYHDEGMFLMNPMVGFPD